METLILVINALILMINYHDVFCVNYQSVSDVAVTIACDDGDGDWL